MDPVPDISVVVLSWNTMELTRACLGALRICAEGSPLRLEVIVIDNASGDDSLAMIRAEFPEVRLYRNDVNQGYARGVNQGLALATGRSICLLGSDTEVRPGTFERLLGFLDEHPEVGAVAPRLVNPDGSIQRACMRFPDLRVALAYDTALEDLGLADRILDRYKYQDWSHDHDAIVDQPPGTCLMVKRAVYEAVGPMDRMLWLFFNDVDWCLRIRRAGWRIWYLHEGTSVLHHLGQSTGRFPTFPFEWHKNRLHFYRKHYHVLGSFVVKMAMIYVALRELRRIRRNLESNREFVAHASQVLRALGNVLIR
ncbi:MAG: glycosyltransferase family 2 protein [Planctomycetes bacterium]|nr:glycosyltransferase family 2 protein [Planctomycetota bacterium]